jgi:hypothetical protein
MYVWRFPLAHFAALLALAAVVIAWEVLSWCRRQAKTDVIRGVLVAAGVLAALSSPFLVQAIVDPTLRDLASRGMYVHFGSMFYLGPAVAAAILFGVSRRAVPLHAPRAGLARTAFWLTAVALATINLANLCNPGWCERFGLPFPYSWWSDSIMVVNGWTVSAGKSVLAIVANVVILLGTAIAVARACVTARSKPPDTITSTPLP